jgi:DNA-binding beta-propeller fold protein YncE
MRRRAAVSAWPSRVSGADRGEVRRWRFLTLAIVCAGGLIGCGDAPPAQSPAAEPAQAPQAAEPAQAPPDAQPAGRVIEVGAQPEGVIADAATGLVAVAVREPNALVLVEAGSGEVTERVGLPGSLRHLQLAGHRGPVLVPVESADTLLAVALPLGDIDWRAPTGRGPHDATAAADGTVFVTDEFGGELTVVRDGEVVATLADQTQPGGVAAVDRFVAVIDVRQNDLTGYDAVTLRRIGRVAAGDGPTHVVAGPPGRVIVSDTRGNALIVFEVGPSVRQVVRLEMPGAPYGLAYDPRRDRVWVTLTGRNEVVEIDAAASPPAVLRRFPTVRQPNSVAVDADTGRVFVTGTADGVLQIVDP